MAMPATKGSLKSNIKDMKVGDYIICKYVAASNVVGTFSELGTSTATEIPVAGSATPNGSFYLVKVDKGLLIADRNIQHTISWDTLNVGKYIQGKPWDSGNAIPTMTSNTAPSGVASASAELGTAYSAWKSFNRVSGNSQYWFTSINTSNGWLAYDFQELKVIRKYTVRVYNGVATADRNSDPKDWTFEGWNGTQWIILHKILGEVFTSGEIKSYVFSNNTGFTKYRINVISNRTGSVTDGVCIDELEMFDTPLNIRSLSGGVSFYDVNGNISTADSGYGLFPVNNEWDKYIVGFPVAKIQSGKTLDDVFHWNGVVTWCQDTPSIAITGATARRARGLDGAKNGRHSSSNSSSTAYGFRPVFEYQE